MVVLLGATFHFNMVGFVAPFNFWGSLWCILGTIWARHTSGMVALLGATFRFNLVGFVAPLKSLGASLVHLGCHSGSNFSEGRHTSGMVALLGATFRFNLVGFVAPLKSLGASLVHLGCHLGSDFSDVWRRVAIHQKWLPFLGQPFASIWQVLLHP